MSEKGRSTTPPTSPINLDDWLDDLSIESAVSDSDGAVSPSVSTHHYDDEPVMVSRLVPIQRKHTSKKLTPIEKLVSPMSPQEFKRFCREQQALGNDIKPYQVAKRRTNNRKSAQKSKEQAFAKYKQDIDIVRKEFEIERQQFETQIKELLSTIKTLREENERLKPVQHADEFGLDLIFSEPSNPQDVLEDIFNLALEPNSTACPI